MITWSQINLEKQDRHNIKQLTKLEFTRDQSLDRTVLLNTIGIQRMVGKTVKKEEGRLFVNPVIYMTTPFQKSKVSPNYHFKLIEYSL